MHCKVLIALVASLLAAVPLTVQAGNGIFEYEMPFIEVDYIPCLGEEVEFDVTVTVRSHYIELNSGGVHYVENWFIEGTATGVSSGLTWYGRAASPYGINTNGAEWTEGWILAAMYEPLDGGQKFRKSQRFRLVYDANGITRVDRYEPYQFRCIGN